MTNQMKFERYESKYLINTEQFNQLMQLANSRLKKDQYGQATICNLYFDTPNYAMIRHSIEKPSYKEKLRIRAYGQVTESDMVFVEIKKKFDSIVYKRRICLDYKNAIESTNLQHFDCNGQIANEINYLLAYYRNLTPSIYLAYDRCAFQGIEDQTLRVTFDTNIIWRNFDLDLKKSVYGNALLKEDEILMEIKTPSAIPLWLTKILCDLKIYKTSYSKYGEIYKQCLIDKEIYYDRKHL